MSLKVGCQPANVVMLVVCLSYGHQHVTAHTCSTKIAFEASLPSRIRVIRTSWQVQSDLRANWTSLRLIYIHVNFFDSECNHASLINSNKQECPMTNSIGLLDSQQCKLAARCCPRQIIIISVILRPMIYAEGRHPGELRGNARLCTQGTQVEGDKK